MSQLITLECPYGEALRWITETLKNAHLQVATSFDLRIARSAYPDFSCPHHGPADCDCQIVMLLVYGPDDQPATLVVHGSDGRTWLSLTDFFWSTTYPLIAGCHSYSANSRTSTLPSSRLGRLAWLGERAPRYGEWEMTWMPRLITPMMRYSLPHRCLVQLAILGFLDH